MFQGLWAPEDLPLELFAQGVTGLLVGFGVLGSESPRAGYPNDGVFK
jgi:hypothetical protein